MSPTCSSNPLAGSTARSATVRITMAGVLSQLATQTQAELSQPHSGVRSGCDTGCRARGRPSLGRAAGGTARGARACGGSRRRPVHGRPPAEPPGAGRRRGGERQHRPLGLRAARERGPGAQGARARNVRGRRPDGGRRREPAARSPSWKRRWSGCRPALPDRAGGRDAGGLLSREPRGGSRRPSAPAAELDRQRAEVARAAGGGGQRAGPAPATPSVTGARIRWVGA